MTRLFTFGCSFTQYWWPTWADILGYQHDFYENWGRCGAWWDYAGVIADHRAGILVVAAPENTRPLWSHARDYGFLAINPTGPPPGAQDVPSVPFTVATAAPFTIRATFILHSSPTVKKWDPAAAAETLLAASQDPLEFSSARGADIRGPTPFLPLSEPHFSPSCAPTVKSNFLAIATLRHPRSIRNQIFSK